MLKPEIVDHLEPLVRIPTHPEGLVQSALPGVLAFTIHDGSQFPRHLFGDRTEEVLAREDMAMAYGIERDWGANLVARHLAVELDLGSYLRVDLARMAMDFGRFPGVSSQGAMYLRRHAIFDPLQALMTEEMCHGMLRRYYDTISQQMVQHFAAARITLGVHTYDKHNSTGTVRPELSVIARSLSYQQTSDIPPHIFDPLFPAIVGETTADRLLVYHTTLALERGGRRTSLDYPYAMPEGSVEMRAQAWFFFRHLRDCFTEAHPETRESPAFQRVWQMLLDTVRRSTECERLRAFLHRYREAPRGSENLFAEARRAYVTIREFLDAHPDLVEAYLASPERPSCVGIEVRKDLLSEIDTQGIPVRLRPDADEVARDIARDIASALRAFFAERGESLPTAPAPTPVQASGSDIMVS